MDLFMHLIHALFSFSDEWKQDIRWKINCSRQVFGKRLFVYILITLYANSKWSSFQLFLKVLNLEFL
jgi:hypothetical protein